MLFPFFSGKNKYEDCVKKYDELFEREVYTITSMPPEFEGGTSSMVHYITKHTHLINYKKINKQGVCSKLRISFVVEENGEVNAVRVIACADTLENTLKIPNFKPAQCNGENVAYKISVPIIICLR